MPVLTRDRSLTKSRQTSTVAHRTKSKTQPFARGKRKAWAAPAGQVDSDRRQESGTKVLSLHTAGEIFFAVYRLFGRTRKTDQMKPCQAKELWELARRYRNAVPRRRVR